MNNLILIRNSSSDQGTPGTLYNRDSSGRFDLLFKTLELPWMDNKRNISCIPTGKYSCKFTYSPHFKTEMYLICNVPDRSGIRIHSANYAGDISKGYKRDLLGCIALGTRTSHIGQLAVFNSRFAIRKFQELMQENPFNLHIYWGYIGECHD